MSLNGFGTFESSSPNRTWFGKAEHQTMDSFNNSSGDTKIPLTRGRTPESEKKKREGRRHAFDQKSSTSVNKLDASFNRPAPGSAERASEQL